jgi:hypothetical protein
LKPKEICKTAGQTLAPGRFDLRQSLNYLKVKTTGWRPAGAGPATAVSVLQADMFAS